MARNIINSHFSFARNSILVEKLSGYEGHHFLKSPNVDSNLKKNVNSIT